MQIQTFTIAPTPLDRDGISVSQTPGAAGNLTITGALASGGAVTFATPQRVTIWSGSNIASRVFTFYGTLRNGYAISEAVTGVNNSTVVTQNSFKTITRVAVDAGTGAAVEAGVNGQAVTGWWPTNYNGRNYGWGLGVNFAGTPSADMVVEVQYTYDPLLTTVSFQENDAIVFTHATLVSVSAKHDGSILWPVSAIRLAVTAYTSGTAQLKVVPGGI